MDNRNIKRAMYLFIEVQMKNDLKVDKSIHHLIQFCRKLLKDTTLADGINFFSFNQGNRIKINRTIHKARNVAKDQSEIATKLMAQFNLGWQGNVAP